MKKAIIIIIVAAAAVCACGFGYFEAKSANSSNKVLSSSNSATSSSQTSNLASSNSASNNQSANNSQSNNNSSSNDSDKGSNTNNAQTASASNANTNNNATSSQASSLNVSSNFTDSQIQTLENIINAKNISPGAGTDSLVINLDYYSVVNGQKYYKVYGNMIPGTNWYMAGQGPFANKQGNYSQLEFMGYMNQNGQQISQEQFLNGKLSFNANDTNNLNQQDIYNMVKKTAIMYATLSGFAQTVQQFNPSELTNYTKNITVNINNTKNIGGETYYEVEYVSGQPFYISLTGNIYVSQEHYLSKIFDVPAQSNAQLQSEMKGI